MENEIKPTPEGDVAISSGDTSPQKSKKIVPIVIALIALIAIGGVIYWQYIGIPKEDSQIELSEKEESTEEKVKEKGITFQEVINECKNTEEPFKSSCIMSACDAIGTTEERIERCIKKEHPSARDVCLNLITPKTVEVCENMDDKDFCYLSIAEETGDVSMCDRLPSGFTETAPCYIKIAKENKNPEICQKVKYDDDKNRCLALATGDVSKCNDMKYQKQRCYLDVAKDKDDLSICDSFEGVSKGSFENSCYIEMAYLRKDITLCDNINENYREECYQEAKEERDKFLCDNVREYSKELCIQEVKERLEYEEAMEKGDASFCEREVPMEDSDYSQEEYKNECRYYLAIEKGDVSLCNKLSLEGSFAGDMKVFCYWYFVEPIAEELNKNFDEKDQILYNQYCKESEFLE